MCWLCLLTKWLKCFVNHSMLLLCAICGFTFSFLACSEDTWNRPFFMTRFTNRLYFCCSYLFSNRYYYDKNMMTKVTGHRYAYQFNIDGLMTSYNPQTPTEPPTGSYVQSQGSVCIPGPSTQWHSINGTVVRPSVANPTSSTLFAPSYTPSYWPY